MAEPFSVTCGVAGLLSLAIELFKISKKYAENVNGASRAITDLIRELRNLQSVLLQIEALNSDRVDEAVANDVEFCSDILLKLRDSLAERTKGSRKMAKLKHLTWPFSETRTMEDVQKIHRYLTIFQTFIDVDANVGVRQTLLELKSLRIDKQTEHFQSMLRWLSNFKMREKHEDILAHRSMGSGDWLLRHEKFQAWLKGDKATQIWCPGDPESGKSVMASIVIDHIMRSQRKTEYL